MRVQERPDELAADVFQAKLKVRVLKDGVMAGVKRSGADIGALLFADLFRGDQAGRVAGARRGDGRIERMREGIAQRDARDGALDAADAGAASGSSRDGVGEGAAMLRRHSTPRARLPK